MEELKQDHLITWGVSEEEEERAKVDIWKYIFGFVEMAVVKCAIELGLADIIENHGRPMTLLELSSALGSSCVPQTLHRVMRFLASRGIFKEIITTTGDGDGDGDVQSTAICYAQTPLSLRLMTTGEKSMAAFILMEISQPMLAPWHGLSARVMEKGAPPFEAAHGGEDVWSYAEANPAHCLLIEEAMACDTRVAVPAIIDGCSEVFDGVSTLVDVGGGNGTALRMLVKACPWIRKGINFDLPHVVSASEEFERIKHVGGDMFDLVPKADAVFLKWVLHDWGDEECIRILKKCREAIPKDKGKVIIVEAVIGNKLDQQKEDDNKKNKYNLSNKKLKDVGLALDMVMMAHTRTGKERTSEEWAFVLRQAGFCHHILRPIAAVQSVIVAFPT